MERNFQRNGLVNLATLLIAGGAALGLAGYSHAVSGVVRFTSPLR